MMSASIPDTDFRVALNAQEEGLEIEFKRSLKLTTKEGKAKLAKEICALCNFGGGWVVFGRDDNGEYVNVLPDELVGINQDTINQISATYLSPAPHCTLRWVRPEGLGFDLPVIWVPSVDSIPVCVSKNGPQDDKGRIVGVQIGTHYTRAAGPTSLPISSPDQWADVIRRCVLSDKTKLLSALSVMMSQPTSTQDENRSVLDADFDFLVEAWKIATAPAEFGVDLSENFVVFGFELVDPSGEFALTSDQIKEALSSRETNNPGPHDFFELWRDGKYSADILENAGRDGLQSEAIQDRTGKIELLPSMWRVSEACAGVEIVAFWEDTSWLKSTVESRSSRPWEPGKNFWLATQIEYLDGFLRAVECLTTKLEFQGKIRIRASYHGLNGRQLNTPRSGMTYSRQYSAKQNNKDVDLKFDAAALEKSVRSTAIAIIIQKVNKLFQGPVIEADTVVKIMNAHRRG